MKDNWFLAEQSPKIRDNLSKKLNISPITAQILINRGIKNEIEAESFLSPTLFDLPSPFLMKDMEKAVDGILGAILNNEKIAIYGDYDVDGVTATSLFHSFFKLIDVEVYYYNPDRLIEGYGINFNAVKKLKEKGVSLIVSGDCGITAWKEVEQAKQIGIDFIITDHHKPPEKLPDSVAVLNPHQPECKYPADEITGVGVIFNLLIALRRALRDKNFFKNGEPNLGDFLDLVALGTVADCAPIINVNRLMVKEGIKRISRTKRKGLIALKEVSSIEGEVSTFDLGFKLGPRINAVGRLGSADAAVELLITDDLNKARHIAKAINQENANRQNVEAVILEEALKMVEDNKEFLDSNSLVLASKDWHPGLIGIVASRICEKYQKPAFLISIDENGVGKGSGRGIEGINLYTILSSVGDIFEQFGGHELAAGIVISEDKINLFRKKLSECIKKLGNKAKKELKIDCKIDLSDVDNDLVNELNILAPFGIGNPEPVFLAESVEVISKRVFKNKHMGLKIRKGKVQFDAIWFNLKEMISITDVIDIVFTPEFNNWNGKKSIRFNVKDINLYH